MTRQTQFKSENFLMSVLGHLILVVIMIFSFSVVVERAKLVTPNRIQIVEIDLKNVRVSGNETKLQNTSVPEPKKDAKPDKKDNAKQNINEEKTKIKQPSLMDNEEKGLTKENTKNTEKKTNVNPAPKKKTLVKVNREVLSLDRTMTVSVVDALRVALTRCWNIDTTRTDLEDIRLTAHLKMLPSGVVNRVWFESESQAQTDPSFAYVLDTVRAAIRTCSPFSMLPRSEYETWKDMVLTFYPSQGKIM